MITQYGVLAFDIAEDGAPRFLLITSRGTGRWVIPRGNPIHGLSPSQSAAQEAYEEAGLTGFVSPDEIGRYEYLKVRRTGPVPATVHVFPLRATVQSSRWPERHQRGTRWFSREEAAESVDEPGLAELILGFSPPELGAASAPALPPYRPPAALALSPPRIFRALMPGKRIFFDMFARHSETLVGGADTLCALFSGKADVAASCRLITAYEHQADTITRDVLLAVRRSFSAPFSRAAVTRLISSMDDAIDAMRDTAKAVMRYDLTSFEPQMCEMAAYGGQAARLVAEALPLLRSARKHGASLDRITENIVHLEGVADERHEEGLKALFALHGENRPMAYIVGREIYGHLERVLDGFEDVANEIQGIVIDRG